MINPELADQLRSRPNHRKVMTQRWVELTFIHFAVEPEAVQRTLPPGLTVDVFPDRNGQEKAWIGLVPFEIQALALSSGLRIPTASRFLETNVRTYVHREGQDPGVWFYSLDAASYLACRSARIWYGLPYWPARMSYKEDGSLREYHGRRWERNTVHYDVQVEVGGPISQPQPGDFEFFLAERYLLYSFHLGRLRTGRVFHSPYPLHNAKLADLRETLVESAGLSNLGQPDSILFSPGVDVEVFPLRPT